MRNSEKEKVGDQNSCIISAASFHWQEGEEQGFFLTASQRERGLKRLPCLVSH